MYYTHTDTHKVHLGTAGEAVMNDFTENENQLRKSWFYS